RKSRNFLAWGSFSAALFKKFSFTSHRAMTFSPVKWVRLCPPRPPLPITAMLSFSIAPRARRNAGAPSTAAPAATLVWRKRRRGRVGRERGGGGEGGGRPKENARGAGAGEGEKVRRTKPRPGAPRQHLRPFPAGKNPPERGPETPPPPGGRGRG